MLILASMIRFVWLFLIICSSAAAEKGRLVVLYGTSCAGKSTLADELEITLPGNFKTIRRTEISRRLHLTDSGTQNLEPAITEIEQKLNNGENLIFDICLYKLEQLNQFDHMKPIYVLVYAPIPDLSSREMQRSKKLQYSIFTQERQRESILNEFYGLYEPVRPDNKFGSVAKCEIVDYYLATRDKWFNDRFSRSAQKLITAFRLKTEGHTPLAPKKRPTVFIDTSKMTPRESARLIKHWL